ncbi:unnamed protein product [Moneuplotes crassus]|uniref:Uncharacterized protein n=1 Tax=Euplotes crassus TaxID=5936 RepID=A0AAD1X8D1_EUPCR|nr:unnamed protein product [Moneuplotes crassus]
MSIFSSPKRLKEFGIISDIEAVSSPVEVNISNMKESEDLGSLRQALIDLYLDVKIRSSEDLSNETPTQKERDREKLSHLSLCAIVSYIKSTIEILMAMKLDESQYKLKEVKYHPRTRPFFKKDDHPCDNSRATESSGYDLNKEYEIAIQKLEADARNHIRTGKQQLKLHIESVHAKIDEAEEKWHRAESEKRRIKVDYESELIKLRDSVTHSSTQISELTADLEKERKSSSLKTEEISKLEAKIIEIEQQYIKESMILKSELAKFNEEESYKTLGISKGDHFTTDSHKKLSKAITLMASNCTPININQDSQNSCKNHQKAMSISSFSQFSKIKLQEPKTSKLTKNRLKGEIQRNLLRGYLKSKRDKESSSAMMELSTRTPDRTNTEFSPYLADMYQKSTKSFYNKATPQVRSSSNCAQYTQGIKISTNESSRKPTRRTILKNHKKSKSQSSISGVKSMDNRHSGKFLRGSERVQKFVKKCNRKPQTLHTQNMQSQGHKRHLTDPKMSAARMQNNLFHTYKSKSKCIKNHDIAQKSKRLGSRGSIKTLKLVKPSAKSNSSAYYQQNPSQGGSNYPAGIDQMQTFSSSFKSKPERRCASSIGCYLKDVKSTQD